MCADASGGKREGTMKTLLAVTALLAVLNAPVIRAQNNSPSQDNMTDQDTAGPVDPALAIAEANPVQTIAPADVLKMMQSDSEGAKFALVDTQPVDGYVEGHIPGAINYPWVMRIKQFPITLPRDRTLIFYGSCPNDTSDMVKKLEEFGYMNVKIMDGGWYKWLELKYPAAGKAGQMAPAELSQLIAASSADAAAPRAK
jgi:rhodanese-related sulfurtransferase